MAIPIKERGIRWVESYSGEKSSHLKEEMDSQIGPGAYCRWEGHDPTTGNDYYVVVSPGFSKKRGFHFFAGLRKMPADHGASGKKFTTQREAMSHARETWQVPPPRDKPPTMQGYRVEDIQNAPILREIQHKSHASSEMTMEKLASLAGSASEQPHSERRIGSRITADILCYAYAAAPVIGFLPAMFSRPRFTVVDVVNVPDNHKVFNEFTGRVEKVSKGKATMAPAVATYQPPGADEFQKAVYGDGVDIQNELVKVSNKGQTISRVDAFGDAPGKNYRQLTWDMLRMSPTVSISARDFMANKAQWNGLWNRLRSKYDTKRPASLYCNLTKPQQRKGEIADFECPDQKEQTGLTTKRKEIRPNMRAEIYDDVIREIKSTFPNANIVLKDATQGRLQYVREAEGDEFNWKENFGEVIKVTGSTLLRYDDAGLPLCIVPDERSYTKMEQDTSRKKSEYIVKDPAAMVLPYASNELEQLGILHEYMTLLNSKPENPAAEKTWSIGLPRMFEALQMPDEAACLELLNDPQHSEEWKSQALGYVKSLGLSYGPVPVIKDSLLARVRAEIASMMENHVNSIIGLKETGELYEPEHGTVMKQGLDEIVSARTSGNGLRMKKAADSMRHSLMGFKWLAATGNVPLSNDQFVHSYTAAPELIDHQPDDVFHMDEMGISPWATMDSPTEKDLRHVSKSYALPCEAEFPSYDTGTEHVRVGRWYDVEKGQWHFGRLPENVRPVQGASTGLKGLPAIIRNTNMMLSRPDGSPMQIDTAEGRRYRTSAGPEGPEAIIEGHYDALVAPEYASTKRSDAPMVEKSIERDGFILMCVPTGAYEASATGKGTALRQYKERNVIGADPKRSPSQYDVKDENGNEINVADRAFKVKGKNNLYFEDNEAAFLVLAKIIGRDPRDLGPLTVLNMDDQRIIDAHVRQGVYYANCVDEFRKQRETNEAQFFDEAGNLMPIADDANKETRAYYKMVEDGMAFEANLDEKMYEYGSTCRKCSKSKSENVALPIRQAYNEAVKEALEDPSSVFKRNVRELFGIAYLDDGEEQIARDEKGDAFVFGSVEDAEAHLEAFRSELSDNLGKQVDEVYVRSLGEFVLPYAKHQDPEAPHVVNQVRFEEHVQKTWGPGGRGLAPGEELPGVEKPRTEWTEEEKKRFERPPDVPLPGPGVRVEDLEKIPRKYWAEPEQPATEPQPPQPQPETKPQPSGPSALRPIKSSVIERLIALADKLDSSGRDGEADAVDRVLRATCRNQ